MLKDLYRYFIQGRCCFCDAAGFEDMDICRVCLDSLPHNNLACDSCGIPVKFPQTNGRRICGSCLISRRAVFRTIAPYLYEYPVPYIVHSLKFHDEQKYARLMGELMASAVKKSGAHDLPDVLMPVPLHKTRQRQRGFNQAELIARYCGQSLSIPVSVQALDRVIDTPSQTCLARDLRKKNLRKAFSLKCRPDKAHIAIVDDVMTTGTTVTALAWLLRKSAVARVDAWVFARTE